jgi:hypothetical protein
MTVPVRSHIDRRLLLTVRLDPDVARRLLPEPLEPQLVRGWAVAGICCIRLRDVRPVGLPTIGVTSENVAHRIAAVCVAPDGAAVPGVYVPCRHTSSRLSALLGGRLLEGELSHARFDVTDTGTRLSISVRRRGGAQIEVTAGASDELRSELFSSVDEASRFFQNGRTAYSPNHRRGVFEAVELESPAWAAAPVSVERFRSTFFEDTTTFPSGSWALDSGLIVRDVQVRWHPATPLSLPIAAGFATARGS